MGELIDRVWSGDLSGASPEIRLLLGIGLLIGAVIALQLVWGVVAGTLSIAGEVAAAGHRQIQQKFWRDAGKLSTVVSLLLLVLAYGVYGQDGTRSLWQALLDLGAGAQASLLPKAIVTHWVLTCALWLLLGPLLSLRGPQLLLPLQTLGALLYGFPVFLFVIAVQAVRAGDFTAAASWILLLHLVLYALHVLLRAGGRLIGSEGDGGPVWALEAPRTADGRRYWRWWMAVLLPAALMFVFALVCALGVGVLALLQWCGVHWGPADYVWPRTAGQAMEFSAFVTVGMFLAACVQFRSTVEDSRSAPPVIFHLVDFSIALSAVGIALFSLSDSTATLGSVPVWLVAAGPGLAVAIMVFASHLIGDRDAIPRWRACVLASVAAATLVGPAKAVIGAVLAG